MMEIELKRKKKREWFESGSASDGSLNFSNKVFEYTIIQNIYNIYKNNLVHDFINFYIF